MKPIEWTESRIIEGVEVSYMIVARKKEDAWNICERPIYEIMFSEIGLSDRERLEVEAEIRYKKLLGLEGGTD